MGSIGGIAGGGGRGAMPPPPFPPHPSLFGLSLVAKDRGTLIEQSLTLLEESFTLIEQSSLLILHCAILFSFFFFYWTGRQCLMRPGDQPKRIH